MALEEYAGDMNMCCRCSACKFVPLQQVKGFKHANVCPSISRYNFHFYAGGGRVNMGAAGLQGRFQRTRLAISTASTTATCAAAATSPASTRMDMEVLRPIQELRIKAVDDGHAHPALDKVVGRLRATGSMVPVEGASAATGPRAWVSPTPPRRRWTCSTTWAASPATTRTCRSWRRPPRGSCRRAAWPSASPATPRPAAAAGPTRWATRPTSSRRPKKSLAVIKQSGAKTLVTSCAVCYQVYNVLYDRFDLKGDLEVLHMSQMIASVSWTRASSSRRSKTDLNVTYHDPCHLGRLGRAVDPLGRARRSRATGSSSIRPSPTGAGTNGVYEPPREVLAGLPGVTLTEMDRIKEYAWCGGSCGGVTDSNPEFAEWTAAERLEEAASTGAEAIVTASPWSEKLFSEVIEKNGGGLKVYDIVELVDQAI